ncbi:MAG: T9SS type A sorting domain-containing protein [Saprospiraceae bacterium]|nr:T9SS type A sorting domain-containing protein [Saprospiraceae bacterium]
MDATDFMSLLQGKVTFRVNLGTLGNGFLYSLLLDYTAGQPAHPYSNVTEVWHETYDFGNPANLQPVPEVSIPIAAGTKAAKLKLVSTGHGWGDNNTGNAAEFHEDTHHIWVNGQQTFEQYNYQACNPNPDGCSPQNGTLVFPRAGWCPGAIAQWFDYDMTPYATQSSVSMKYVFNEDYVDLCHANHPDCVSGVTCPDCNDGFNPHLIVACYLISSGDAPLGEGSVGVGEMAMLDFSVFPNPTSGLVNIGFGAAATDVQLRLTNSMGQTVLAQRMEGSTAKASLQVGHLPKGIYLLEVKTADGMGTQKLVVE